MKAKIFPSICKTATVVAYICMACPFACLYFAVYTEGAAPLKTLMYTAGLVVLGYAVQAFFGLITRFERLPYKYTNSLKQYFSAAHIALPVICGVILAFVMASRLYSELMAESAIHRYSAIPLMYGVVIFALFTLGCVLWFFPYAKLISKANMIAVICIFVAGYMISTVLGVGYAGFVTVCFLVYITIAVFLINQAALEKYFKSTGRSARNTRVYNAAVSIVLLFCILLTTVFVIGLMAGTGSVLRDVAAMMLRDGGEVEEEEEKQGPVDFGTKDNNMAAFGGFGDFSLVLQILIYVDAAILILGGAFVFIMNIRDPGRLRSIIESLKRFFRELFDLLLRIIGFRFRREKDERFIPQSYHEEHIDISAVNTARWERERPLRSYSEFKSRLEKLTTPEERYKFAYSTMMTLARSRHDLKSSHTPREATAHLLAQGWDERISKQTENYEFTAYSPEPPSSDKLEDTLSDICGRVRSML